MWKAQRKVYKTKSWLRPAYLDEIERDRWFRFYSKLTFKLGIKLRGWFRTDGHRVSSIISALAFKNSVGPRISQTACLSEAASRPHSTKQTSLFEHLNKKSSKHTYTCSGKRSWLYLDGVRDKPEEVHARGTILTISGPFCSTKQSCKVSSHSLILYPDAARNS